MFVLRDGEIEVTRGDGSDRSTAVYSLRTVSPDYTVGSLTFTRGAVLLAVIAIGFLALALFLAQGGTLVASLAIYATMFAIFAAVGAAQLIPRFDFLTFSDHWKRPLFSIAREKVQTDECDSFVADLLNRIEQMENEPSLTATQAEDRFAEVVEAKPQPWSKRGLVCGAVTLFYPLLAQWFDEMVSLVPFVVLAGATGAVVAPLYAYVGKERHRHWSLVGVGLAGLTFLIFD